MVGQLPGRYEWRIGDALNQYHPFVFVFAPVKVDGESILMGIIFDFLGSEATLIRWASRYYFFDSMGIGEEINLVDEIAFGA
ncbi:hypothetical protein [Burkholderia diffusa]|uniref:hypothetical protein n=1 Tax=Burkholderia diffusa TaxID=488732 RepID=UPI00157B3E70|nr:hypothetical protein [Burkholderia diffusa]NTY36448.1 hypothetical protein [Burkholderia diffusa]